MATRLSFFLVASLLGTVGGRDICPELVVWNVGQGQWVTVIDEQACWHLDMGGEFAPWSEIISRCRTQKNRISLSHWDMDHIVFVGAAKSRLPNLCLINAPLGQASPKKEALISPIPRCVGRSPFAQWSDPLGKTANSKSWVVRWRGILAQGDSPRQEEKKWISELDGLDSVRILILGHHGSRTSTSRILLESLRKVQMAVSSARFKRYGHPHPEVVSLLSQMHIPLLRTEEWGTLHFRLD